MESTRQIWVDADACPGAVREIVCRAAERVGMRANFVANRHVRLPRSPHLRAIEVRRGFDVADARIVDELKAGDLVVTQDIPLAAEVIALGAEVIGLRGETLDEENIQERLATRNLMEQLRNEGLQTGGPSAYGAGDRQTFANALDRWLARK